MKKIFAVLALAGILAACNNTAENADGTTVDTTPVNTNVDSSAVNITVDSTAVSPISDSASSGTVIDTSASTNQ